MRARQGALDPEPGVPANDLATLLGRRKLRQQPDERSREFGANAAKPTYVKT
jgi:hypothetical protein